MAQNGKVNPDCSYAANPYHECTETGLREIREPPPQKNKNSSGVVPLKFGWKKNRGSKPEPPHVRDRIPASKVKASSHSEKKKLETEINEHVSSDAVSMEKHIQDVMVIEVHIRSPSHEAFVLGLTTYLYAAGKFCSLRSIPSQLHWLLQGFLLILFLIFCVLLYSYAQPPPPVATPSHRTSNRMFCLVLGIVTYFCAAEKISSLGTSIPSQQHWLLQGFLLILFLIFCVLLYSYAHPLPPLPALMPPPPMGPPLLPTPCPDAGAAVANEATAIAEAITVGGCGVA
ncbi:hypothetical protein QN277_005007 [Acacia crassicarpa]|uniref:Uncharacterized protein n=1 Tax=Acacia crassicarpa TaxID=499986 RepID=A0AAE1IVS4_9FABA|nr:hypothetical protein QN277_005007 [Acacia crassicarpa]